MYMTSQVENKTKMRVFTISDLTELNLEIKFERQKYKGYID